MIEMLIVLLIIPIAVSSLTILSSIKRLREKENKAIELPEIKIDLSGTEARLAKALGGLPDIIVNSITGSANTHKGKLGELIGYISMKAEYDRIIPLGSIVDFMAIKFSTDTEEGYVHFIDIKTGKHSRLTSDQKNLKDLLKKEAISFKTIKVDEIETD